MVTLTFWRATKLFSIVAAPFYISAYNVCCCVTSVVSDSVRPHRRQPTRLPCPWDCPGKSTGVGCHCLLWQCMRVPVFLNYSRPTGCEVASQCGFELHLLNDWWYWIFYFIIVVKLLLTKKRCTTWELWVKFYLGQNEDCSLRGSTSDLSESLLQSGSGGKSIYKVLVKGEFNTMKHSFYKRFFC